MTRIAMLLENSSYPQDVRVRSEAESLTQAGHLVTVVAPALNGQPHREVVDGVRVIRFTLPQASDSTLGFVTEYAIANLRLYWAGIGELLRGATVVHSHNPPDTLFGVSLLARLLGRKAIFDHHDLAPELFEAKFGSSATASVLRLLERASMRSASAVVAANESHAEIARERGGVAADRVFVVRNGPPAAAFEQVVPGRDGVLADPRLLFLGCMESQDGVDQLLPIMERLATSHDLAGAHLTLVGEGSLRAELEAEAAARGLAERVHFTGRVPFTEVPGLLAEADICLDPAPCTELNNRSTMIKIGEYMTAARPVVAYPLLETERTGGDAVSFAEADDQATFAARIATLAGDPELRAAKVELGVARAGTLGWDRSEQKLLALYAHLTG
jgi:glycosyltransferase involved in cell wall biosynthesis